MTDPKFPAHAGFLATHCGRQRPGLKDQIVGEGLYVADCESGVAELGLSVTDEHQRRGIGSLLLETLLIWAGYAGLVRVDADVLADNYDALRLLTGHRFRYDSGPASGVCRLSLPIRSGARSHERADSMTERMTQLTHMVGLRTREEDPAASR